eukprot:GHVP01057432.1.p2 GENE.GHVP01057432.1~~GHVP01057432.1.p2  ORF type:complete len:125 (-),score=21.60 GHVP01057432.1:1308-1682(-)
MELQLSNLYQLGNLLISKTQEGTLLGVLDNNYKTLRASDDGNGSVLHVSDSFLGIYKVLEQKLILTEENKMLAREENDGDRCFWCMRTYTDNSDKGLVNDDTIDELFQVCRSCKMVYLFGRVLQ